MAIILFSVNDQQIKKREKSEQECQLVTSMAVATKQSLFHQFKKTSTSLKTILNHKLRNLTQIFLLHLLIPRAGPSGSGR